MRKGISVGLLLISLGLALFLASSIPVTSTTEVINTSFTLRAGAKNDPYETGTYYSTRLFGRTMLRGEVDIVGEGVYLTVTGYNTRDLQGVYVNGHQVFVIELASTFAVEFTSKAYTFIFDNTRGLGQTHVTFELTEVYTTSLSPVLWVAGVIGLISLIPVGLASILVTYIRTPNSSPGR